MGITVVVVVVVVVGCHRSESVRWKSPPWRPPVWPIFYYPPAPSPGSARVSSSCIPAPPRANIRRLLLVGRSRSEDERNARGSWRRKIEGYINASKGRDGRDRSTVDEYVSWSFSLRRCENTPRGIGIKAGTFAATLISTRGAMETWNATFHAPCVHTEMQSNRFLSRTRRDQHFSIIVTFRSTFRFHVDKRLAVHLLTLHCYWSAKERQRKRGREGAGKERYIQCKISLW